jgi:hypothetical protein
MENVTSNRHIELEFAGGETAEVDAIGNLGDIQGILCSSSLTHECLSISQMSKAGYVVVFDESAAYVLKRGVMIDLTRDDVLMTAKEHKGLYRLPMNKFIQTMINETN